MDCYISLREETAPGGAMPGPGTDNDFFMFDDDDLYQVTFTPTRVNKIDWSQRQTDLCAWTG